MKARKHFPDPLHPLVDEIVAADDRLSTEILVEAYSHGIFPWPHDEYPLLWFSPDRRGVLWFKKLHIPTSLQKFIDKHKSNYHFSLNQSFAEVIENCSQVSRKGQAGTWITPPLKKAYLDLHQQGYAHSLEVWKEEKLVAGIYGVFVEGVFSGESMFQYETNASKLALLELIQWLKSSGLEWLDVQMVTPLLQSFGAEYVDKLDFYRLLRETQQKGLKLIPYDE